MTGCIGIPLSGSFDSQFFERSARHRPETVSHHEMAVAKHYTVFISTRPPIELPFAAEVNLQVYDDSLKLLGFSDVEMTNNPLASHHWHPEYENFRLRWLSSGQSTQVEFVNLLWLSESSQNLGLAICIQGSIEPSQSDSHGRFRAHNVGITPKGKNSNSWTEFLKDFQDNMIASRNDLGNSMSVKCFINTDMVKIDDCNHSSVEVKANLRQQDVFGNEIYVLTLTTN